LWGPDRRGSSAEARSERGGCDRASSSECIAVQNDSLDLDSSDHLQRAMCDAPLPVCVHVGNFVYSYVYPSLDYATSVLQTRLGNTAYG
jgi:hypothetical protein